MRIGDPILRRMFIHPRGLLGRLGGLLMVRFNRACGNWAIELLDVQPGDHVLEVGFGSGVLIGRLADLTPAGHVTGIDESREMVAQARARNAAVAASGHADIRSGSVERLPFPESTFDKALAINSMQAWPDAVEGLREVRRVLKPEGKVMLGFTPYSGQPRNEVKEILRTAGFKGLRQFEKGKEFCVEAVKP